MSRGSSTIYAACGPEFEIERVIDRRETRRVTSSQAKGNLSSPNPTESFHIQFLEIFNWSFVCMKKGGVMRGVN